MPAAVPADQGPSPSCAGEECLGFALCGSDPGGNSGRLTPVAGAACLDAGGFAADVETDTVPAAVPAVDAPVKTDTDPAAEPAVDDPVLKEACVSAAVPAVDDLLPLVWCLRLGLVQCSIVPKLGPCTMLDCAFAWALYNARLCLRLGLVQC